MKRVIIFILLLLSYAITTLSLSIIYQNIQSGLLRHNYDLLIIHSKYTNAIFAVGLINVFFILWFRIYTAESSFKVRSIKVKYLVLAVLFFCMTNIFAVVDMFSYSVIRDDGLYIRENIFSKTEFFDWGKIKNASIEYNYGTGKHRNNVYFHYFLNLPDERKIDLKNSEEFRNWEKVIFIDDYLKTKGMKFNRYSIDNDTYKKLLVEYESEFNYNADKVFEKIFVYNL